MKQLFHCRWLIRKGLLMKLRSSDARFLAAFIAIAMVVGFSGCSKSDRADVPHAKNEETVVIIDGTGNEVTVHKPVERIIVEYMDNAELIRILNVENRVVGVSGYDYVFEKCERQFPELRKKPSLGLFWNLDYEAVLKLAPDLLLTFSPDTTEKREKLPGVDVVFLGLYYPNLLDPGASRFIRGVRNLGEILDAQDLAQTYIDWHLGIIERIRSRTERLSEDEKPKIFIAHANAPVLDATVYKTASKTDTLSQACILAGGNNIAGQLPEFSQQAVGMQVDAEWLIAQNPDIMILHAVDRVDLYGYETDDVTELEKGLKAFMARPELAGINAVKNRKVYIFDGHFRNDASGGVVGAAYLAKIFHPDLFGDMDPEAIHEAYLGMQNLNYDVNRHGVFVFPPLETNSGLMGIPDRYKGPKF